MTQTQPDAAEGTARPRLRIVGVERSSPRRSSGSADAKTRRQGIRPRPGRGTIYRRRGSYRAEITINGVRVRHDFATEEAAQLYLEEQVKRALRYGISLDRSKVTLRELFKLFLEAKEVEGLKRTTLQDYRNSIAYWNHAYGDLPVQHLQAEHVTRLMVQMRRGITTANVAGEIVTRRPLAAKQIANVRSVLRTAIAFALDQDIVDRNVVDKTKPPRIERKPPKGWAKETARAFLDAIASERLAAMFYVFLAIGIRKGELCALKWPDVDLDTGQVTIQRRLVRLLESGIDVDVPKSSASVRRVVLSGEALAALRAWRERQKEERVAAGDRWLNEDWVFTTGRGNHLARIIHQPAWAGGEE